MIRIAFIILAVLATPQLKAQSMEGPWLGKLKAGMQELTITLLIERDASGQQVCTMGSPDQGVTTIPTEIVYLSDDSVNIAVPKLAMAYAARRTGDELHGTFVQRMMPFKLDMRRGELQRNRPQTPQPPYPYTTEEVTFENTQDSAVLAGTLCYPVDYKDGKRIPVVLMVTGSGQQDRNETLFDHQPFAVIADHLARHGIASLRYDDRGVGGSKGEVATATSHNFMLDAEAGVKFLRKLKRFSKVGVLGHSEGGMIAFMMGAHKSVDFIVSMAGPAQSGDSISAEQTNIIMRQNGYDATYTAAQMRQNLKQQKVSPWVEFFYNHNPQTDIIRTKCPVLALNGEKDTQVTVDSNLKTIERLLPKNKKSLCKVYPELNHLSQHCQRGTVDEYAKIEETISTEVLDDIVNWITTIK